jgi:O-antigen ligase
MLFIFNRIDDINFFLGFFFIYPLLPGLWGLNLPAGLPILRAHRVATMILIFYLIRNDLLTDFHKNFFKSKLFTWPIILIILSMFISSLLSDAKVSSFFFTMSFIFEFLILGIVAFNAFKKPKDIERLINILCLSCIAVCILALYEFIFQFNPYTMFGTFLEEETLLHTMRDGEIRINGPHSHAISFGAYLALMLPLMLYRFRHSYLTFYGFLGLVMIIILATKSRSAQIGAGIAIMTHFIFIEKKKIGLIFLASTPVLIILFNRFWGFIKELNPLTTSDAMLVDSNLERVRQLDFYTDHIQERVLFGYGLEPPPFMMRDFYDGSAGNSSNSIDNYYLGYTFQFGLFGLLGWVYLVIENFRVPIVILGKKIFEDKLLISLLFGCIIFHIINYIVFLMQYHFIFWIYLGLIARIVLNYINSSDNIKKRQ